ncbi:MAG: hypothetical protein Hyperionvirus4_33 [Hyperionvirus sp.]|uniref:RNI-like protein n=1 Tax=Hyperionvirus sp. TaxID=2487770 RepID=A0A3G5A7B4_9VIRU|nr:MAG: hypothetical protein Hyperionvirus4_33 [Hyperionvirus sp.]
MNSIYYIPFQILSEYLTIDDLVTLSQFDEYFNKKIYKNIDVSLDFTSDDFVSYNTILDTFKTSVVRLSTHSYREFSEIPAKFAEKIVELLWELSRDITIVELKSCVNLKKLTIDGSNFTDSQLSLLTELTSLTCARGENTPFDTITDLGLRHCTKLVELGLFGWQLPITDYGIETLTNLTKLSIGGDGECIDLTARSLTKLSKLRSLGANCNGTIDDQLLASLSHLTSLCLSNDATITNEGIKPLTNLLSLNLYATRGITEVGFQHLTLLEDLTLDHMDIKSDSFKYLVNLTSFSMCTPNNLIPEDLLKMTKLGSLALKYQYLPSISDDTLSKLTNLTALDLTYNKIITDHGIISLLNLGVFNGPDSNITTKALLQLPSLRELTIYGNSQFGRDEALFVAKGLRITNSHPPEKFKEIERHYSNNYW